MFELVSMNGFQIIYNYYVSQSLAYIMSYPTFRRFKSLFWASLVLEVNLIIKQTK